MYITYDDAQVDQIYGLQVLKIFGKLRDIELNVKRLVKNGVFKAAAFQEASQFAGKCKYKRKKIT